MQAILNNATTETTSEIKRRGTSILLEVSHQERAFWEEYESGKEPGIRPHLIDISVYNEDGVIIWYTIEPDFASRGPGTEQGYYEGIMGWDVRRRMYMMWNWPNVANIRVNTKDYAPVDETGWDNRIRESNVKRSEKHQMTQHRAKFW